MSGIEAIGATITLDAAAVGTIVGFSMPEDRNKKFICTGLSDTREQAKKSAMKVLQVFSYTIRYDTIAKPVTVDSSGVWVETMPLKIAGNTNETNTFSGFVESVGPVEGDVDTAEGLTQVIEVSLTSEVVTVLEA